MEQIGCSVSSAQKTVLIVYAHQSQHSFNAAVRDVATQELVEQGYRVIVSDLYAMNFRAAATPDDITGDPKNPELFQYGEETMHAWMEGRLSDDITAEQRKVEEAELIIFQFPLYWFSVPAIMKGWMDRVLVQGFAFSLQKLYNNGIFKDKKAMLSFTTGATQTMFRPDGINGDINITLWPLQNGILHFCGFQVLAPQIFWSPAHCPPAVRTAMLDGWRARLKGLLAEKPLTFAPCELFDLSFQGGFLLRPEVREERESQPHGLTTGHHLGKPLPPDNQIKAQPTECDAKADGRN
uniref:NAD(P)H dehydrogenase [quinone] 1 isoform X1 n=1 Tax=Scatophagus argus TaxID=75038 RepID=UPI001ED7E329|nr:NAD(P)H dehydrogenase [quinone] 1 isoform X1 [Scatophagus argus]